MISYHFGQVPKNGTQVRKNGTRVPFLGPGSQKRVPGPKNGTHSGTQRRMKSWSQNWVPKLSPRVSKIRSPGPGPGSPNWDSGPKIGDLGPENRDPYVSKVMGIYVVCIFLVACTRLYKSLCRLVGPLVRWLVGPLPFAKTSRIGPIRLFQR